MSSKKANSAALKTTLAVTLVIFLSKAAGFIRDIISAGYFATGIERDAYASAYSLFYLPVLLFSSCITSTIVPLYVNARHGRSVREANRFASNSINIFAIVSLLVSLLMMALAGPLVSVVYGGFSPDKQLLTAELTRIMLPSLAFVVVSIVMSSVLNATQHFLAAQLTGFPLTVGVIVATVFFSQYGIRAVSWGVFAAGIMQMLILLPALGKSMRYTFRLNIHDKRFQKMMVLAVPAMISMAVNELNHMIDKSLASYLNSGDISAMDYAYRLITFATGVLAVPITTVMFSRVSICEAEGNRKGVLDILTQSAEVLTMILLPVTMVGCVLSEDIIKLAYMHGKFGMDSVQVTSGVFLFYLVGILGFGLRDVYNRAFHALQDTKTPMRVAYITVALNVVLDVLMSKVMGANGLALATSVSCAIGAVLLVERLHKKLGKIGMRATGRELIKIGFASLLCLACAMALNLLIPLALGKLWVFLRLLLITGTALIVYLAVLIALRARQLKFLGGLVRRRRA
ncbi:MAG: murein biosynthesis integral membrane protein MurJ [Clostridia bacterium]